MNQEIRKQKPLSEKQIQAEMRKLGKDMEQWHPGEGKKKPKRPISADEGEYVGDDEDDFKGK